jgi:indole-3-acetate monooxygenase
MSTLTAPTAATAATDIAEHVRAVAPLLRERALEGEHLRTMPADVVETIRAARLFDLALPRSLGGLELDPTTIVSTIEQLAHADGSAGWTTMIGNSNAFLAWLDPAVAASVVGDRVPVISSVFAPMGRAVPDADHATVDGRWSFASGCLHADLFFHGVLVFDGPGPRMLPDGRPDWRFALFSRDDAEIIDTWDAMGLRGTGSHDVTASGVRVPLDRVLLPFDSAARHDGPLWRFPFHGVLGILMSGFPLGVGQRALDELATLAPGKRRANAGGASIAEDAHLQVQMGRIETRLRGARSLVLDTVGAAWETARNGDAPTRDQLANMQMAMQEGVEAGIAAVDLALRSSGSSSVYSTHPVQRCFRDLHTAAQHIAFSDEAARNYARTRFGLGD